MQASTLVLIVVIALAVAAIVAVAFNLPELRRYFRIRRM
jgi:hypothetical protein